MNSASAERERVGDASHIMTRITSVREKKGMGEGNLDFSPAFTLDIRRKPSFNKKTFIPVATPHNSTRTLL